MPAQWLCLAWLTLASCSSAGNDRVQVHTRSRTDIPGWRLCTGLICCWQTTPCIFCSIVAHCQHNTNISQQCKQESVAFGGHPVSFWMVAFSTDVYWRAGDSWCDGFLCRDSGYCIASKLRCNKMSNCGKDDDSDETGCKYTRLFSVFGQIESKLKSVAYADKLTRQLANLCLVSSITYLFIRILISVFRFKNT